MVYNLAHFLQNRVKPVWSLIEGANSLLFKIRYGAGIKRLPEVLYAYPEVKRIDKEDIPDLADFFSRQPESSYTHFNPHKFDRETLAKLVKNPSRLIFVIKEDGDVVGYFFLRCFFIGKSYLGKMVDADHQGKGIGQRICCCAMDIALLLKMKMFESISKENFASLQATQKVLETRVLRELNNGDLYIEDVRKK